MNYQPRYPAAVAPQQSDRGRGGRLPGGLGVALGIAALTAYLGFNAGGFFPGATGIAAVALCVAGIAAIMLAARPQERLTPALLTTLFLLLGLAVWTLVSVVWSDAPGRALLEFDRVLLYALAFALFGILAPGDRRLEWGLRGFAAAASALCAVGWVTRVAADVWPISPDILAERLSFPLTYWNAMGLLTALALVACFHLSSSRREPRLSRVLAAAAIPLLSSTLLLTYSRAALVLLPLALIAYAAVARPRRMVSTLFAAVPPAAVAMLGSYAADKVSSPAFASTAAIAQGHKLALLVIGCSLAAGLVRGLLAVGYDRRLEEWVPPYVEPRTLAAGVAGLAAVLVLAFVALGGPGWASREYRRFVNGDVVGHHQDPRQRLTSVGNNGRVPQWEVGLESFAAQPLRGEGAGTYQLAWARHRPYAFTVIDAHSLYVESLGELGIVGFLLIVGTLLALIVGLARRVRAGPREAYAALLAMTCLWAVHAGVDWDWEMPAVTVWVFALGAIGLARPLPGSERAAAREPARLSRVVAAICVGVLAVTPAAIAISQSHLQSAVADFRGDDCPAAIDEALASLDALKVRPEPYEVLGYCDIQLRQRRLALLAMRNAVEREPNSWETHYGLGLALAAAGRDPMPQLREAKRLNPLEAMVGETIRMMSGASPRERERRALVARLPV